MKSILVKQLTIILLVLTFSAFAKAQDLDINLSPFENLIGGTWKIDTEWGDGTAFKQEITYTWSLSGKIISSKTIGNISKTGYEQGLRNEGVRVWSSADSTLKFWEFDVFGGVTQGKVLVKGKNHYYQYEYETGDGVMTLTDGWEFVSNDEYTYSVGVFKDGKWSQKYLSGSITRKAD